LGHRPHTIYTRLLATPTPTPPTSISSSTPTPTPPPSLVTSFTVDYGTDPARGMTAQAFEPMAAVASPLPSMHAGAMSRPQVGIERLPTRRMSNEPRESMNCKSCRKRKVSRPRESPETPCPLPLPLCTCRGNCIRPAPTLAVRPFLFDFPTLCTPLFLS
jgi:hypothetical protein